MGLPTNRTAAIIVYGILCGILMVMFILVGNFTKYAFSLAALLLGIRFFGQFEEWKTRIILIVVSFLLFIVFLIVYVFFGLIFDWPLPEGARIEE